VKKKHHYILFGLTLVLTVVCAVLMLHVNVNSDMTKYLPDDSQMKEGLEILDNRFGGAAQSRAADIKLMICDATEVDIPAVATLIGKVPGVDGVTYECSEDGEHVLYNLNVPKSIDQKALGGDIRKRLQDNGETREIIVETSQDGATPPFYVMIIAALLIMLVLVVMSPSWMEPLAFLLSVGVAVVLNIGTNALLPSVSITTNYIVGILQMVLSLDYSIVLLNRYRQEFSPGATGKNEAMNRAIRKAYPSIVSSALTTVVGLLMLCFMRLKIGTDMGVVLAKGVVMSLICTFTVLPSLLLLMHNAIERSRKKVLLLPTDRIGAFTTRYKYPLAVFAVLLFAGAYYGSQKTSIFFSNNGQSTISKFFPRVNPVVVIYHTEDEQAIIPLADSLSKIPGVNSALSYPTLFKQQLTADEMCEHLTNLGKTMGASEEQQQLTDMLSPEYLRMVYYLHSSKARDIRVTFPALGQFIIDHCLNNPMFASAISPEMREGMGELEKIMATGKDEPTDEVTTEEVGVMPVTSVPEPVIQEKKNDDSHKAVLPSDVHRLDTAAQPVRQVVLLSEFAPRLYAARHDFLSEYLMQITDTNRIRRPMAANEMSQLIGSSSSQTQMVYSLSKNKGKKITPLQYVHILTDDLFQRRSLQAFVKKEQKRELRIRARFMDEANSNTELSAANLVQMLREYGMNDVDEDYVRRIAFPAPVVVQEVAEMAEDNAAEIASADIVVRDTIAETIAIDNQQPMSVPKVSKQMSRKDPDADLFAEMFYSGKEYSAEEMARNFKHLGQDIDAGTVELLYAYYGSICMPDSTYRLNLGQLFSYITDTLVNMPVCADFLTTEMKEGLDGARQQMNEGVAQLRLSDYSLLALLTDLPDESDETYQFVQQLKTYSEKMLPHGCYLVGESVMYNEMKEGFNHEMTVVTVLTVLAIFLIVAVTFRSLAVPVLLTLVVLTAVYVNVVFSGIIQGRMLYLAYLIVQSILMGATIDYGILLTHYYRESRLDGACASDAVLVAYRGAIHTIMTSGMIMVAAPGAMALMVTDVTIQAILAALSIGALAAVLLILFVLPGLLVVCDRWIVRKHVSE